MTRLRAAILLTRRRLVSSALAGALLKTVKPARASVPEDVRIAEIGVPIEIQDIGPGSWRHFELEGSPVFVRRLTPAQIAARPIPADASGKQADGEWVVVSGICTHEGCRVAAGLGSYRGFACPCHGSEYDVYGQVRQGPAPRNLSAAPHTIADGKLTLLAPGTE